MVRQFNTDVAKLCGPNAAVVVEIIMSEILDGYDPSRKKNLGERTWVKCSQKDIAYRSGYLSADSVSTAIGKLVNHNIVRVMNLSDNKFDHTYWYTITNCGKALLLDGNSYSKYDRAESRDRIS